MWPIWESKLVEALELLFWLVVLFAVIGTLLPAQRKAPWVQILYAVIGCVGAVFIGVISVVFDALDGGGGSNLSSIGVPAAISAFILNWLNAHLFLGRNMFYLAWLGIAVSHLTLVFGLGLWLFG